MKGSALCAAVVLGALASTASAVVTLSISKSPEQPLRTRFSERATITESLINNVTGGSYFAEVTVAGQPITLVIDTGSSDVWLMSKTADICTSRTLQTKYRIGGCASTYDSTKSKTYKVVRPGAFDISYADGSGARGDYISDTLEIGEVSITALQMGIAYNATLNTGLLGIGYDINEASNNPRTQAEPFVYPSIIDTMVTQGLINIRAYSLYLDDLRSSTGSIIFGGMDTDKFQGSLYQLPVVPQQYSNGTTVYAELAIEMTSLSVTNISGTTAVTSSAFNIPAVLDSGTTITYLPSTPVAKLYAAIGAVDDTATSGEVFVDCNLRSDNSLTFDYGFGGGAGIPATTIRVPISELIFDLSGAFTANNAPSLPFTDICAFGIQSLGDQEPFILGDTFLRSAYVVYDLTNNLVAIGQTNFDSSDSNIIEFSASQTAIPSVSGAASAPDVTQTATSGIGGIGNPRTSAGGSTSRAATVTLTSLASTGTASPTSGSNSAGARTAPSSSKLNTLMILGISSICAFLGGAAFMIV